MEKEDIRYQTYVQILKEELIPAMGCTEPIAISYCAAKARAVLGCIPEDCLVEASGNIIKNVKSVVVPNTDGLKGIEAAAAAGIVAGKEERILEVISAVTQDQKKEIRKYLDQKRIRVKPLETEELLDIVIQVHGGGHKVKVRIAGYHSNIVRIEKDGDILYEIGGTAAKEGANQADRNLLNVKDIVEFADTADIRDVQEILDRQIEYNSAISEEGLRNPWGANVGKVLMNAYGNDIRVRARAAAAAASDARMSGCEMPVIINSGSGNQGITASLPVLEYAKELHADRERLYRALLVSNLVAIHQKTGMGRLSAYCGAVSAGCGSAAGIAWLYGREKSPEALLKDVSHTIVNTLAVDSGIVCDGAKASCAAKIASAVDAGLLGFYMYRNGQQFRGGDGIVSKGVEATIHNIGLLAAQGMRETDREILDIMTTRC